MILKALMLTLPTVFVLSTAKAEQINVKVFDNLSVNVNIEDINNINTNFITSEEKSKISSIVIENIPVIGRKTFYKFVKKSENSIITKEFISNEILFTVVKIGNETAVLVDDFLFINDVIEPMPPRNANDNSNNRAMSGRCKEAVIAATVTGAVTGAIQGSETLAPLGPVGAGVGSVAGAVIIGGSAAAVTHAATDACDDGTDRNLFQKIWDAITK